MEPFSNWGTAVRTAGTKLYGMAALTAHPICLPVAILACFHKSLAFSNWESGQSLRTSISPNSGDAFHQHELLHCVYAPAFPAFEGRGVHGDVQFPGMGFDPSTFCARRLMGS